MRTCVKIEMLKLKRSFSERASILMPLISVLLVFLMSDSLVLLHLYNWWIIIVLPITLLMTLVPYIKIDNAVSLLQYEIIAQYKRDAWYAKVLVSCWLIAKGLIVLLIGSFAMYILSVLLKYNLILFPSLKVICTALLIYIYILWQIPIILALAVRFSLWICSLYVIVSNSIIGFICATSYFWYLIPWSYPYVLEKGILGINPNGLLNTNHNDIPLHIYLFMIIVCIILLYILNKVTANWYTRNYVKYN